ncbi:MAG: hypothetical protein IKE02_01410, partial [Lachnospiraceae bacterium]|nr:hypothetical protein [Lachnospiraceae bacterium]
SAAFAFLWRRTQVTSSTITVSKSKQRITKRAIALCLALRRLPSFRLGFCDGCNLLFSLDRISRLSMMTLPSVPLS